VMKRDLGYGYQFTTARTDGSGVTCRATETA